MSFSRPLTSLIGILGLLVSAIAILKLVQDGFRVEFIVIFSELLKKYEEALNFVLGPIEPYVRAALKRLSALMGWHLELQAHWKSIFTLLLLYFSNDVKTASGEGRRGDAIFHLFLGLAVAFIFSVITGTVPLTTSQMSAAVLTAALPLAGLLAYSLLGISRNAIFDLERQREILNDDHLTSWDAFRIWIRRAIWRTLGLFAIIMVGLWLPVIQHLPSPGLALLLIVMVSLALYWIGVGIRDGFMKSRATRQPFMPIPIAPPHLCAI